MSMNLNLPTTVLEGRRDFFRVSAQLSPLPGASYQQGDQFDIYCTGADYAPCNGVIDNVNSYIPSEQEIEEMIAYFQKKKLPFIWWSDNKKLEEHGFQYGGILTGIALDLSEKRFSDNQLPAGVEIKQARSQEDIKIFSNLVADVFGFNEKAAAECKAINSAVTKDDKQIHFLAYLDGSPVGAATLSIGAKTTGIWNLATAPECRKSGIGHALVSTALNEAKKRGHNQAIAILMPKGMAWGLFARLGFEEVIQFPFFVYGVSADALE